VQPFTLDERLAHARQAVVQLGASIPWLVDPIDNRLKRALGDRPNSEFVVNPQGTIVRKRAWSNPTELRKDLETLVGAVEKITRPEDVHLNTTPTLPEPAAKGTLPRVSRAGMFPLVIAPQIEIDGPPFYAKLRCEADLKVVEEGKGRLYLGFHLDPFHGAHWNSLTKPLRFELEAPEEIELSRRDGEAPPAESESDIDPREFLLDVAAWPDDKALRLHVTYSACAGQSCHEVRQSYVIRRQRDQDGGGAPGAGFRGFTPQSMFLWLLENDLDGDGSLTKNELTSMIRSRITDYDVNNDGVLTQEEIRAMASKMTRRIE
jgi:hypothetical protein